MSVHIVTHGSVGPVLSYGLAAAVTAGLANLALDGPRTEMISPSICIHGWGYD
eukprot:CAMPEP_0119114026 /NCGR_PEP_ID=MMETSP1180-20130426/45952_1 /TAXON_ID=3052 ORGANISM="Chlamydomonas cf sp, Strain CCMP681" /NCGR_SAMPLE_ID=MMETSP1180 /ASSEMBLY_ACC=CAM_ASM_000741 /LENGTH=52 /DNA_ID=CAMNT_0007102373 /DNA_START=202 /DNA_END=360 /DNA_ORIENTATION=-